MRHPQSSEHNLQFSGVNTNGTWNAVTPAGITGNACGQLIGTVGARHSSHEIGDPEVPTPVIGLMRFGRRADRLPLFVEVERLVAAELVEARPAPGR